MSAQWLTKASTRPAVFLGIALVLSIAFIVASMKVRAHFEGEIESATNSLHLNKERIRQARMDLDTLNEFQPAYDKLVSLKVVGDEPRLDWTELLAQSAAQVGVPNLRFEIAQRTPYRSEQLPPRYANLPLFNSRMTVSLTLMHEVQLLDFFRDMSQRSNGYFIVDSCVVQSDGREQKERSPLQARCEIDWITLNFDAHPSGEMFGDPDLVGQL